MTRGVDWDFGGRQLSIGWALALCYSSGFRGDDLITAVAVMTAESARFTQAWHINYPGTAQQSIDRGLFQLNDKAQNIGEEAFDPIVNAKKAHEIYRARDRQFTAWAAFNSGRHAQYSDEVKATFDKGRWRNKIERVGELSP